jgi:O-antigen/teichoic acid export membrane protein
VKLGRATILLLLSQTIFLAAGLAVNLGLARLLGVIDYGRFGLVLSVLVIAELFVITGIPEVVQKFGGERPAAMAQLVKKTLRWQALYTVLVFAAFELAAPGIARLLRDPGLTTLLRLAGLDLIVYGLYKYFLGVQNGLHRFAQYTWLGITYSLVRVASILVLVWLGFSVPGALIGNAVASAAALLLALIFYRPPQEPAEPQPLRYGAWAAQNVLYFVGLNAFFAIDLWFVKYFLSAEEVGLYVSAAVLAKLSYFMSIAISAVLLPSLSRAIALRDEKRASELAQDTLRYLLIFLTLANVIVALTAKELIALFFGEAFIAAAPVLRVLMAGLSGVTLMAVINTIMIARNRMAACFAMVAALVVVDVVLSLFLVPRLQLLGGAIATSLVGLLGAGFAFWHIRREAKPLLLSWSIPRTLGIALGVYALAKSLEFISIGFILKAMLLAGVYFLLLWLSKEINAVDLRRLRESLGVSK